MKMPVLPTLPTIPKPDINLEGGLQGIVARMKAPRQFEEAIARQEIRTANDLYRDHRELIERERPLVVSSAVRALNEAWEPQLVQLRQELESTLEVEGATSAQLAQRTTRARELLSTYRALPLLASDSSRHSESARALERASAPPRVREFAERLFARTDATRLVDFLDGLGDVLPPSDRSTFVESNIQVLSRAVNAASELEAIALVKAYRPVLSADASRQLQKALQARWVSGSKPLTFDQLIKISKASRDAGLEANPVRIVKLSDPAGGGALTVDGTAVTDTFEPRQLPQLATQSTQSGQPLLVAIDVPIITELSRFGEPRMDSIRKERGTTREPNPAYASARERLEEAQRELREVEASNAQLQVQARSLASTRGATGLQALGAVMGSAMGTGLVESARESVADARRDLSSTPQFTSRPVYGEEQVLRVLQVSERQTQATVYLIDTRNQTFRSTTWREQSRNERQLEGSQLSALEQAAARPTAGDRPIALDLSAVVNGMDANGAQRPLATLNGTRTTDRSAAERTASQARDAAEVGNTQVRTRVAEMMGSTRTASAGASGGVGGGGGAGSCPATMAVLDSRLPRFAEASLQRVREEAVATQIVPAIQQWKAQGKLLSDLVDQLQDTARTADQQVSTGTQCASAVSSEVAVGDDGFAAAVNNGSLARLNSCEGIRNACLCGALLNKMTALVSRSLSAAVQCHSRTMGP